MDRNKSFIDPKTVVSRRDLQEIILAKMAGGDLYANEYLQ